MNVYVFRLKDSPSLQGIVVIFATKPQRVRRRLATDKDAEQVTYAIAHNEVTPLGVELEALPEGATVTWESPVLWQLVKQSVVGDHPVTFKGRHTFPVLSESEDTFRRHVNHCNQEDLAAQIDG